MDKKYLEHIMGSSYVDEKSMRILQLKASQCNTVNRGYLFETFDAGRIESYWRDFYKKLHELLNYFEQQTINKKGSWTLTSNQSDLLTQIDSLRKSMHLIRLPGAASATLSIPSLIDSLRKSMPLIRLPGAASATLSIPSLTEAIQFNQLKTALKTNDPATILNACKNEIKSLYRNFLNSAAIKTGNNIKNIETMFLSSLHPSSNIRTFIDKIKNIETVPTPVATPSPTSAPPSSITPTSTPITPSVAPPTVATPTPTPSPVVSPTTAGTSNDIRSNEDPTDYAFIINTAVDIIIETVQSDIGHAEKFLGPEQKPLPKSWGDPLITKEADIPQEDPEDGGSAEDELAPEDVIPGTFLYNFASKYRKLHTFSIEVGDPKTIVLPVSKKQTTISVVWNCKDVENDIYAISNENGKTSTSLIFRFGDDQVNAANVEGGKGFNINKFVQQADSFGAFALDPTKVSSSVLQQINDPKKMDNLFRALYATRMRKAMEFVSKRKGLFVLRADKDGNVQVYNNKGKREGDLLSTNDIAMKLLGPDKEKWKRSLEYIHYPFLKNVSTPTVQSKPEVFTNSVNILTSQGIDNVNAQKLVQTAWDQLFLNGKFTTQTVDKITVGDIFSDENIKQSLPTYKTAVDAIIKLGHKPIEANTLVDKAWNQLISKGITPDKITEPDILQMVLAGHKPIPPSKPDPVKPEASKVSSPVSNPVSTSAGSPPEASKVSSPVSTDAGNAKVSSDPTSPVSNAPAKEKEPEKTKEPAVNIDDKGVITVAGINKTWKVGQMIPKTLGKIISQNPSVKDKYDSFMKKKKVNDGTNPFQRANFL
jgi:hypothetical protein